MHGSGCFDYLSPAIGPTRKILSDNLQLHTSIARGAHSLLIIVWIVRTRTTSFFHSNSRDTRIYRRAVWSYLELSAAVWSHLSKNCLELFRAVWAQSKSGDRAEVASRSAFRVSLVHFLRSFLQFSRLLFFFLFFRRCFGYRASQREKNISMLAAASSFVPF